VVSALQALHLEIIYQGEHCPQCFYMREAVETVASRFGGRVRWTLIDFVKNKVHAQRFFDLSVSLYGTDEVRKRLKCAPIPSLFFDGELVFDVIPRLDELEEAIKKYLSRSGHTWKSQP